MLGIVRIVLDRLEFAPSLRRLPHVGSKVAFLSNEILQEVAGHNLSGSEIGWFALGEFVYSGDDKRLSAEPWMRILQPQVIPRFDVKQLVSRRTFVFARAGYGKTNLVKLLFSNLYATTPTVPKRESMLRPVGTIIFDRDGEYFWPDDKGRPGLCDVPLLQDKLVVFTNRDGPSPFYRSFVAGDIKLDIRRLRPADVVSIALSAEKQDQQNVRKLKGLSETSWRKLVDEVYQNGNSADPVLLMQLLSLERDQEAEMVAARANMTTIVRTLHNPSSQLMDMLLAALKQGKLCVIDVSQISGSSALILSGLILRRIFDHNQEEFTKAFPETIPTIAVIEEAQSVLSEAAASEEGPYVTWVKEGRKYDLGAVLVTQQPGSISWQILSQGDNWFVFHLLSSGDLFHLKKANSHFSDDILSSLLNEPIAGHAVYWSSTAGKAYPISIRALSFEGMHAPLDRKYDKPSADTFASQLRSKFEQATKQAQATVTQAPEKTKPTSTEQLEEGVDMMKLFFQLAINSVTKDEQFLNKLKTEGYHWRGIIQQIENALPPVMDDQDRNSLANSLVPVVLNSVFGEGNWQTTKLPSSRDKTKLVLYAGCLLKANPRTWTT